MLANLDVRKRGMGGTVQDVVADGRKVDAVVVERNEPDRDRSAA